KASSLIRDLILRYGMSDLGIIFTQDSPFFGEENLQELSENSRQKIEKETEKIVQQCYQKAQNILQKRRKILDLLAQALVKKNSWLFGETRDSFFCGFFYYCCIYSLVKPKWYL